jgi:hypothetical protein
MGPAASVGSLPGLTGPDLKGKFKVKDTPVPAPGATNESPGRAGSPA